MPNIAVESTREISKEKVQKTSNQSWLPAGKQGDYFHAYSELPKTKKGKADTFLKKTGVSSPFSFPITQAGRSSSHFAKESAHKINHFGNASISMASRNSVTTNSQETISVNDYDKGKLLNIGKEQSFMTSKIVE